MSRTCHECGAPALHDRSDCWSCGRPLASLPSTPTAVPQTAPPVPTAPPCPQCGNAFAGYLPRCPNCGAGGRGANLPSAPFGWRFERASDGALRMVSTALGRFFEGRVAGVAFALTLILFIIPSLIDANRHAPYGERNRMSNTAFALGAVAALAAAGAWSAFGKQALVMCPDLLRVETELGPFRSAREYRCAIVQVEYYRAHRSSGWRLAVDGLGGRRILFRGGWLGKAGMESIGRVIETETGWKLRTGSDFDGWL